MAKQSLNTSQKQAANTVHAVEAYITSLLEQKLPKASAVGEHYEELIKEAGQLIGRGGKRVRPQLVINAYKAFGGKTGQPIVKAAASQEFFHAFALAHDDIIDRDLIRWGGANISGRYLEKLKGRLKQEDARHFADGWALMAGDLYLSLCFEALIDSGFPPNKILKAQKLMQETLFMILGGEVMDVATPIYGIKDTVEPEDYFINIYAAKTSAYSFSTPLRLGAMLAGAGRSYDQLLNSYGHHMGVAFQIKDDILGIFGDEDKLGKSNTSDIREGKLTLLMCYALEMATPRQRHTLEVVLGNAKTGQKDLQKVQAILKSSGALRRAEQVMLRHCDEARNIVLRGDFPLPLASYLTDLLAFSVKRSR